MPPACSDLLKKENFNLNYKYHYVQGQRSVSDNFSHAVSCASGEYITMSGDDDSVHERIADVVGCMKLNSIDGLITEFAEYYWPGVQFKYYGEKFSGLLLVPKTARPVVKILNASSQLSKCFSVGCTDLVLLPRMYYGIVRRVYLDQICRVAGTYIPGPSPDMANAVSLSLVMNEYLYCNIPLFIAGNSAKSAGGLGASKKHVGDLTNKPWLPTDIIEKWSKSVPKFWSGPTIWCESALKAIERMQMTDRLVEWNGHYLHAKCNVFHKKYRPEIKESYFYYKSTIASGMFSSLIKYYVAYIDIWSRRGVFFLRKIPMYIRFLPSKFEIRSELKNIEDAGAEFSSMIEVTSIVKLLNGKRSIK